VTQLVHWSWDTVSLTAEPEQVLAGDTVDQVAPCVAWAGGEALVGWERRGGPFVQSTVELAWVDTTTGLRVDPTQASLGAGFHAGEPAAASRWSGLLPSPGADDDEVLLAFARHDVTPPLDGDVVIQLAEAVGPGGSVVDVGGGCGPGGVATVSGPVALGNPAFAVELDGADAVATLALLNVAAPGAAIPCGSCSFLAPGLLFAQPVVAGGAVQALPILNDASLLGATVEAQWAVLPTASSPCALFATVAMSNRLSLTVDL